MDARARRSAAARADASRASPSGSAPRWPAAKRGNDGVTLALEPAQGGAREELAADVVLVAIGRRPYHRRARPRRRSGVARDKQRPHHGRRRLRHQRRRHLCDRRRDRAGRCWRTRRRTKASRVAEHLAGQQPAGRLRRHSRGRLHLARSRLGRQDRGGAEGGRHRLPRRQVPVHRQRRAPAPTPTPRASSRSSPTPRPTACSGVHIIGPDAGTMIAEAALAMEFGASRRGHRPHLPRPSRRSTRPSRKPRSPSPAGRSTSDAIRP